MAKYYHGSYITVNRPLALAGRNNLDFGNGFYMTNIKEQAENWAALVSARCSKDAKPRLNVYEFDVLSVINAGYRYKNFSEYDLEWLYYVIDCRNGGSLSQQYDIVEGGVANDNVIDTVEDYSKGIITAEQALGQLKYKKVNHQICILSQKVIDEYLTFVEGVEVI